MLILPITTALYILSFLDRVAIGKIDEQVLLDEIEVAIADFVHSTSRGQSKIILPRRKYRDLHRYARGTSLGRGFMRFGLTLWSLPVYSYSGNEIVIG